MPITPERMNKFIEEVDQRRGEIYGDDGVKYFSVRQDGEYKVRILDMGDFLTGSHWGILQGKNGKSGGSIRCPKIYDPKLKCPACELVEELAATDDPKNKTLADEYRSQVKFPMLILDVTAFDLDDKATLEATDHPQLVYEAPKTVYNPISRYVIQADKRKMFGDILDLKTGKVIEIRRGKTGGKIDYSVQVMPTSFKASIDPKDLIDLRQALKPRSYADIEYAIDHFEYPETPIEDRPSLRKRARPEPEPEPEEVEEDDVDFVEEEEESPPPPPPSRADKAQALKKSLSNRVSEMSKRGKHAD